MQIDITMLASIIEYILQQVKIKMTWYLIAYAGAANKSQISIWLGNDDLDASAKNLVVLAEVSQGKNAIINATVM